VSGVLSVDRLTPWNVSQSDARLILNPWAKRPLNWMVPQLTRLVVAEDGRITTTAGRPLREILGVWDGWPGDPPEPGSETI
jgi:hypothetical protein